MVEFLWLLWSGYEMLCKMSVFMIILLSWILNGSLILVEFYGGVGNLNVWLELLNKFLISLLEMEFLFG